MAEVMVHAMREKMVTKTVANGGDAIILQRHAVSPPGSELQLQKFKKDPPSHRNGPAQS
jgi:hypothetical protein